MPDAPQPVAVPTPPGQPAGKPRGRQLLMLILGGLGLAFGGCAMFIGTMNSAPASIVFGAAFAAGVLMVVVGMVAAALHVMIKVFGAATR